MEFSEFSVIAHMKAIEKEATDSGFTFDYVLQVSGVNPRTVRRWKTGECAPSYETVYKIRRTLKSLIRAEKEYAARRL